MKGKLIAIAIALAITAGAENASATVEQPVVYPKHMLKKIHRQRNLTWKFQDLRGHKRTKYHYWAENRCGNKACRYGVLKIWHARHMKWKHIYERRGPAAPPPISYASSKFAGLECIHTHEGAWNADTGNGYYGGLQMDSTFEREYGPEFVAKYGNANHWPAIDQLIAGYRAVTGWTHNGHHYSARGYSPWPNTAAMCGLL